MKISKLIPILSLLTCGASVADPTPTIRFDQPSWFPAFRNNLASAASHEETSGSRRSNLAFDNFLFPTAQKIIEVRWEGFYSSKDHGIDVINTNTWRVSIHADDNGTPVTFPLLTESRDVGDVPMTVVGDSILGPFDNGGTSPVIPERRLRSYSFQLATPFAAQANTKYWISIQSLSPNHRPFFWWNCTGTVSDPVAQRSFASKGYQTDGFHQRNGSVPYPPYNLVMTLLTLPANDADEDGMDDDWENANGLDATRDDSREDPDDDGSTNLREFEQLTNPQNPDTEGDGLLDGVESNSGLYIDETDTGTSPLLADSDRDGLSDSIEIPSLPFVDENQPGSDPNKKDSDGDHYDDGLEARSALDPTDPAIHPDLIILGTGQKALLGNSLTEGLPSSAITANRLNSDRLFNGKLGTGLSDWTWIADDIGEPEIWTAVDLDRSFHLTHFTIAAPSTLSRSPIRWELQGSLDGIHFETIFHYSDHEQAIWSEASQVLRYDAGVHFQRPKAFSVYRFVSEGGSLDPRITLQLGELELFGTDAETTLQGPVMSWGGPFLSFNIPENALPGTRWTLERSTDLESWEAIYHFEEGERSEYEGQSLYVTETESGVSIIDGAPPAGPVFYRLRVVSEE